MYASLIHQLARVGAAGWLIVSGCAVGLSSEEFATRFSPTERLTRERLATAHDSAVAYSRARRSLPPIPGSHDFRCVLHAHAEDATHTGGTRPEMLADAIRAGVDAILLTDHYRPPRDFMAAWRLATNGVRFIPGSEVRGFLVYPADSIMGFMETPVPEFLTHVTAGEGLAFLSHIEERPDHSFEGLTGLEIYNRHYDAKQDFRGLLALVLRLTNSEDAAELADLLKLYPDEILAAQVQYPTLYLDKWDAGTRSLRLTGVAANDCHHNQVLLVKMIDPDSVRVGTIVDQDADMQTISAALRPGIRKVTAGHQPGDVLVRLDFDPYYRSFRNVTTHVFAAELTEASLRTALKQGHAYVSHDWMCDPTGFFFETDGGQMGDEVAWRPGLELRARFPIPAEVRLLWAGKPMAATHGPELTAQVQGPGAYRLEAWLEIGGELRPWIFSNPIYVR